MIPNQWYAILESREVKRGKPVGVTRLGERMAVWRDSRGEVACVSDLCPHRGAALSIGKLQHDHLQCPFHGLEFDGSGRCRLIPANGRVTPVPRAFDVRSYPVREAHGFIWIWWGEPRPRLPPIPFFKDIDSSFSYATFRDHWPVHYSRAVENQLDVAHLPFVHANTIGRGGRTLVDGPLLTVVDDLMGVWVYNRVDDGTPPRKPSEIPQPQRPPFLQFHFPNLWQLRISDRVRIFLSFTPVDEENTLIYMRYYHRLVRVPPVREAMTLAGMLSSIVILRQDKRVVVTQRPKKTDITMKEKLFQADRPIVAYRARRRELIEGARQGTA